MKVKCCHWVYRLYRLGNYCICDSQWVRKLEGCLEVTLPLLFVSCLKYLVTFARIRVIGKIAVIRSRPCRGGSSKAPGGRRGCTRFRLLRRLSAVRVDNTTFTRILVTTFLTAFYILSAYPICPSRLHPILKGISLHTPPFIFFGGW